jgi:hypothetical protein
MRNVSELFRASNVKGHCQEIFDFWFFHESVSPKPLSIPLGPFLIFSKIRGDICNSKCTSGVVEKIRNDPNVISGAWEKVIHEKNLKQKIS